jgi:O-methyltransferase
MASQTECTPELLDYIREMSLRDDATLRDLREMTARLPGGRAMQVMPEEGQFLALLISLSGASNVLEIGTFTGYSTLCMARALPPNGRIVTCDINPKWPALGVRYWERSQIADRIDVRIGEAREILAGLISEHGRDFFDLAFIDADKANYVKYYELAFTLVKPGGLIIIDNTLFFGRVIDPAIDDPDTAATRELNERLRDDDRVEISMLSMADGITLARKIPQNQLG